MGIAILMPPAPHEPLAVGRRGDAEAAVRGRRIVSTVPKPHSGANHLDRRGTGLEGRSASSETKPH